MASLVLSNMTLPFKFPKCCGIDTGRHRVAIRSVTRGKRPMRRDLGKIAVLARPPNPSRPWQTERFGEYLIAEENLDNRASVRIEIVKGLKDPSTLWC